MLDERRSLSTSTYAILVCVQESNNTVNSNVSPNFFIMCLFINFAQNYIILVKLRRINYK